MAWEKRQRGSTYYTRSYRYNGKVCREYIGSGIWGYLAEYEDNEKRRKRNLNLKLKKRLRDGMATFSLIVNSIDLIAFEKLAEEMKKYGYKYHRGEWRKSMIDSNSRTLNEKLLTNPGGADEVSRLIALAIKGDKESIKEVKLLMQRKSAVGKAIFEIAVSTRDILLNRISCKNELLKVAIAQKIERLNADLSFENDGMVSSLIIERIIVSWLYVLYVDHQMNKAVSSGSPDSLSFWSKMQNQAEKRYLKALKTLAQVKRLDSRYRKLHAGVTEEIK